MGPKIKYVIFFFDVNDPVYVIFFFDVNHSNHPSTRSFDPPTHGLTSTAAKPTMA